MPFFIPFSYLTANTINYLAFFENGIICFLTVALVY
jgi:hypothetical protein